MRVPYIVTVSGNSAATSARKGREGTMMTMTFTMIEMGTPRDMAAAIRTARGGTAWKGERLPNGEDTWLLRLPNDRGGICLGGDTAWGDWRGERGEPGTVLLLDEQGPDGETLWYDEQGELVEEVES